MKKWGFRKVIETLKSFSDFVTICGRIIINQILLTVSLANDVAIEK